jgi:hypothetical protein
VAATLTVVLAVSLVVAFAGCGGDKSSPRDRINAYIRDANGLQRKAKPSLDRANETYAAYARGELATAASLRRLEGAQEAFVSVRDRLADITPPEEARRLHSRLLRAYDMSVDFARQTALMGSYSVAADKAIEPLSPAGRSLDRGLARRDARAQARALRRFAAKLTVAIRKLDALEAPLVLSVGHEDQLRRLRATRKLAVGLRRGLIARDSRRVARLLARFRRADRTRRPRRRLARTAIREYNRRHELLVDGFADVRREQIRLARAVS